MATDRALGRLPVLLPCWLGLACATHMTWAPAALPEPAAGLPIGVPLAIEYVDMTLDGVPALVDESLATRVAMDLRQARVFSAVFEPIDLHRAPANSARLRLSLEMREDTHAAANGAKAFVTGLSLFLLAPVFRYDFDAEARVEALARSCDGWSKRFHGSASGSLRHSLFGGERHTDWALRAGVLERALAEAIRRLGADGELRARLADRAARPGAGCAPGAGP